ncbi:MAG TPA: hypothetical protein VHB02_17460 [Acidimicrobiales bacterium]|nr:hypothetical protein [Acidimicrobiales bacterium]
MFVDYDDVCRTGHRAFGPLDGSGPPADVDPVVLADLVARRRGSRLDPAMVRVYRAVPDGRVDEPAFSAALWQIDGWSRAGAVVVRRSLRDGQPAARQPGAAAPERGLKGLAVALAVDLAVMAWRDQYDLAMVCSSDQDLRPAIAAVLALTWKGVDVVAWRHPRRPATRLWVPGEDVVCHWLDHGDYERTLHSGVGEGGAVNPAGGYGATSGNGCQTFPR